MKPSVEPVGLVIPVRNKEFVKRLHKYILLLLCSIFCFTSCKTTKDCAVTAEVQRRFDYFYLEAVKQKLAGRYDDAFELFKHCEQLKPDASEVLYELGCYHLSMNEPENGTNYLVRAVQLAPDNIYFKEALASHYLRVRDKKSAAPLLEDMVRCNPSRSDVLAQLVNIYLGEKNYEAAIKALDRIETLEGRNLNISMEKFRLYREMGELEKGFTELEALAADNPNDLTFKVIIGDQYMIQQQEDKAYGIYMAVQEKEPDNQALRLSLLQYYKQTGKDSLYAAMMDDLLYGKAVEERARVMLMRDFIVEKEQQRVDSTVVLEQFKKIFEHVPETVDMLYLYASYLQMKKMDVELIEALHRILILEPDHPQALLQLLQMAIQREDFPEVLNICEQGATHHPDELSYYFYGGYACYKLGLSEKSLNMFKKGVRQIKEDTDKQLASDMFSIMGDLYYESGERDSAYAAYDSCLVYRPDNIGCLNNYAYYLSLEKRDLDKAEEMSHRTIIAEPSNKTYLDTYAWILFEKGKYAEAKIYMERVLDGDIDHDERVSGGVLEHAGDIYAKCGEIDEAIRWWKKAREKGEDVSGILEKKIRLRKYIEQ